MLGSQHPSLPAHTCLSYNVMDALLAMDRSRAAGVNETLRHVALDQWPSGAASFYERVDSAVLLAADAAGNDVEIRPSTVPGGGRGVFALRDFVEGERILPFCGTLIYEDLSVAATSSIEEERNQLYGKGMFSTSAKRWLDYATQVSTSRGFWDEREWRPGPRATNPSMATKQCAAFCPCGGGPDIPVWVVPSCSCAAGVINTARRNRTSGAGDTARAAAKRKMNVSLYHNTFPVTTADELVRADVCIVLVTRRIRRGEEFFLRYGRAYGGL